MLTTDTDRLSGLTRKLDRLSPLAATDREIISRLPSRMQEVRSQKWIIREGGAITECCILLQGFACRQKLTNNGGRQIVSFHMPGDILDVQHLWFAVADHNVEMVTNGLLAFIPVEELREASLRSPTIAQALWRDALTDASIFREWVLNVGRRDATTRVAHMLCEFAARREAAGLGSPESFELPMTQQDIADATGLTSVHVNRTLRSLESAQILRREGAREIRIADWPKMQRYADFSPEYLHIAA
ncbi:MAG: Crp/Fnr family transcriptional regulator [Alphaproteobacteria bacterium]|nr:MAG: Crp/Fnr family transcriptional regulator [Alphaproteobacteria bacterium]